MKNIENPGGPPFFGSNPQPEKHSLLSLRVCVPLAIVIVFALVPVIAVLVREPFYMTLVSRIMIIALAAVGLNLVLGYGGMVSFGHALYIGVGAYAAGILSSYGIVDGWVHLGAALGAGLVTSSFIGLICSRTSGIGYIMITLAFAQMFHSLAISLKTFGGDDGMPLPVRSDFGIIDINNDIVLYYGIFSILFLTLFFFHRLIHARFGMVLRGAKTNKRRMGALGFPVVRYQLAAYVISALVCVVAGLLLANLTRFVSPSYMHWTLSGELIVMAVLGGMTSLMGPIVGAAAWLVLEDLLSSVSLGLPWGLDDYLHSHWLGVIGLFVIVITLTLKHGIYAVVLPRRNQAS